MLPRSLVLIACTLSIAATASPGLHAAPPQEKGSSTAPEPQAKDPQAKEPPSKDPNAPAEEQPIKKKEKAKAEPLTDRLEVRVGSSWLKLRSRTRGTTIHSDPINHPGGDPNSPSHLQQTILDNFSPAGGASPRIDITYRVLPRIRAYTGYTMSNPTGSIFTDDRLIGNFSGPGDFKFAQFTSDAEPRFNQFNLGAAFRSLPTKKHGPANQYVDVIVEFQSTRNHYDFHTGVLTADPFDPNALLDPVFTAKSNYAASYNMNFLDLGGGFKVGGKISKKLSFEVRFVAFVLGRYDGTGFLTDHGLPFVHSGEHQDRRFHVPGCDSDPSTGNPPCGLIDADLTTTPLTVHQHAGRSRGLNTGATIDYDLTSWIGLSAGIRRDYVRNIGGDETRDFHTKGLPNEIGGIDRAGLVADTATLTARFRFF